MGDAAYDVVVVGSGGAGMSAAVEARAAGARVLVVTKSALGASNTGRAQGGIQAALGDGDSWDDHYADTLASGHHGDDPAPARLLTERGPRPTARLGGAA